MERKLVTIRRIKDIQDIEGADRIKLAVIDGWKTIVKNGEFNIGDYGVYFEIDSLIPMSDTRFEFVQYKRKMDLVEYRYIRTIKLRGQISQGLILPLSLMPEIQEIIGEKPEDFLEQDFADVLGVIKYEENLEAGLGSEKAGSFPFYVEKTGEKRIQNVFDSYIEKYKDVEFVPTLKMDGSSMTVCYVDNPAYFVGKEGKDYQANDVDQFWVGSHRMVVRKPTGEGSVNAYYEALERTPLEDTLPSWVKKYGKLIAVQGELIGPKIQKNFEKVKENTFRAFSIYFIEEGRRATFSELVDICEELGIQMVKAYEPAKIFQNVNKVEDILDMAEGASENHDKREGLVFKSVELVNGRTVSFKAISNSYLLGKK